MKMKNECWIAMICMVCVFWAAPVFAGRIGTDEKIERLRTEHLYWGARSGQEVRGYQLPGVTGIYEDFLGTPATSLKAGGASAGTTGAVNVWAMPGGNVIESSQLGAGQTLIAPVQVATGLDVAGDQAADEGRSIAFSGIVAGTDCAFTIGTSDAFYAKIVFSIGDVSGTDDCIFGFRGDEAFQANVDDYNNMAGLNVIGGTIYIETIDDNAATTTTSTTNTWADGTTHTLEVRVSKAGVVTYRIDGVAPTVTAAFTWDSGDTVVPFFQFLNDADLSDSIILRSFECGYQHERLQ